MAPPACVIVGVDASPESVAALEWALHLSGDRHCRIVAVHAVGLLEEGGYQVRPDIAGLIVVGSRGLGQAPRLLGSTSGAVLAHARLPTVVVPALDAGG